MKMIKRRYEFVVSILFLGGSYREEVEIEFEKILTENQIADKVDEVYNRWVNDKNHGHWIEINK